MSRSEDIQQDHRWEALKNAPLSISPSVLDAYGFPGYDRFKPTEMANLWIASTFSLLNYPENKPKAIFVTGPTAVGKDTILRESNLNVNFVRTVATRPRRPDEKDGREYQFVTETIFDDMIKQGKFLEYSTIGSYRSGVPLASLNIPDARPILFRINPDGVSKVRPLLQDRYSTICIGILPQMRVPIYETRIKETRPSDWLTRLPIARNEIEKLGRIADVIIGNAIEQSGRPEGASNVLRVIYNSFVGNA